MQLLIAIHLVSTLCMVGLIWFVQVVHYPMFDRVGPQQFAEYERIHQQRTTWVVAPFMLAELATAIGLVVIGPEGVSSAVIWCGLILLAAIWLSTALLQVPKHNLLKAGFATAVHRSLVSTNWIRTIAWSGRGVLAVIVTMTVTRP